MCCHSCESAAAQELDDPDGLSPAVAARAQTASTPASTATHSSRGEDDRVVATALGLFICASGACEACSSPEILVCFGVNFDPLATFKMTAILLVAPDAEPVPIALFVMTCAVSLATVSRSSLIIIDEHCRDTGK